VIVPQLFKSIEWSQNMNLIGRMLRFWMIMSLHILKEWCLRNNPWEKKAICINKQSNISPHFGF